MTRSPRLDEADRWLLENDPLLSRSSPRTLANRRIRQQHSQGGMLLDDVEVETPHPPRGCDPNADRLVRLAPPTLRSLVALRVEFPSASQAELARMLGCSRQAVNKKRRRLLAYLEAMAASPPPPERSSGTSAAMPVYQRADGQLAWDFEDRQ